MVEIAPASQLDPHLRDRLTADSVNLARQVQMNTSDLAFSKPYVKVKSNVWKFGFMNLYFGDTA